MHLARVLLIVAAALWLAGCDTPVPPCPFSGPADDAPSAGCLVLNQRGHVLMVESYGGAVSPPGGKTLPGETAQCAAHRETFEETGLSFRPQRLLRTFDTGFNLYLCESYLKDDGELSARLSEVWRALWIDPKTFRHLEWRYAGQGAALTRILNEEHLWPPAPPVSE